MKKLLLPMLFVGMSLTSFAQTFNIPLEGFSRKKTSYLHMEDGSIMEGKLDGFKRAKGLIETIKMKNESGKKMKIDPVKINFMYIPPSALAKFNAALETANSSKTESELNHDLLNEGYVYFAKTATKIKKKTENLMMQLLNTSFASKISVYHDPFAKESMGVSVGGVTVAGGLDKSYYVKKNGDKAAYRIMKKSYSEDFDVLFGDCPEFMEKYQDNKDWSDLEMHILEYTKMCE